MLRQVLLTAAVAAAIALPSVAPSFAKTAPKAKVYFVEQSIKTNACYVVAFKPNPKFAKELGTDSYASFGKAWVALKADTSCAPVKHVAMKMKVKAKTKVAPKPKA